jgi:threonine aldolase
MILGNQAHIFRSEAGSAAAFGGIQPHTIPVQPDGTLKLEDIRAAIRQENEHFPRTRLICLENTQGAMGGMPITAEYTHQVGDIAREHNLRLHIDGARIFNAAAALNTPAAELVAAADSVSFCLSKGLCAPVGSVVVGSHAFIAEARRARKSLGGGMRQAGILAAAGLIALREMTTRLAEDHANACALAEGLATIPHIQINPARVRSNMILFGIEETAPISIEALVTQLKNDYNIVIGGYSTGRTQLRWVTHYWITRDHVNHIIKAMRTLLS